MNSDDWMIVALFLVFGIAVAVVVG